jgi:hypothetical protein
MTIIQSHVTFDITAQDYAEVNGTTLAAKMTVTASPALEMPLGRLMKETRKAWGDLATASSRRDAATAAKLDVILNDLALTIAARPARHWREGKKKIILLAEYRNAVRERGPTLVAILDAVIEQECRQWEIFVVETSEQVSSATKH